MTVAFAEAVSLFSIDRVEGGREFNRGAAMPSITSTKDSESLMLMSEVSDTVVVDMQSQLREPDSDRWEFESRGNAHVPALYGCLVETRDLEYADLIATMITLHGLWPRVTRKNSCGAAICL